MTSAFALTAHGVRFETFDPPALRTDVTALLLQVLKTGSVMVSAAVLARAVGPPPFDHLTSPDGGVTDAS